MQNKEAHRPKEMALRASIAPTTHETHRRRFEVAPLDIQSLANETPKDLDQVLPGLLPGSVGALIGAGASSKSMLSLQIAFGVATGTPIAGMSDGALKPEGEPGRAVVLLGEDPINVIHHRIYQLCRGSDLAARARGNVAILPLRGRFPTLMNKDGTFDEDVFRWLKGWCTGSKIVFIDTLRRLHVSDENDSGLMTRMISRLEEIGEETKSAIVFLHHSSKAAANAGTGDSQTAGRGSSALTDNIRWQCNLQTMTLDQASRHRIGKEERRYYVQLSVPKSNYQAPSADIWLRRGRFGLLEAVKLQETTTGKERREKGGIA